MLRLMNPDVFAFTGILLSTVIRQALCRPKGGRRGASVAVIALPTTTHLKCGSCS
ncbi:hypothetical protein X975_08881, partial [Stegodyphus mimosarum]